MWERKEAIPKVILKQPLKKTINLTSFFTYGFTTIVQIYAKKVIGKKKSIKNSF
jgi:hypothetical protein